MIQKFTPAVRPSHGYPTSDGKPMAETEIHRDLMLALIETLRRRYEADPNVCVSGNLLLFYEEGNRRRHVSPDVFVVFGVPKVIRENYLMWEEGKGPDVVIELTSKTTRSEDAETKHDLYLNVLGVREYFLFDPKEEYLFPSLQGFRRVKDEFRPIREKDGRLPSKLLGLHLERDGQALRLWDPATRQRLPTPNEERLASDAAREIAEEARQAAEAARLAAEAARQTAESENERLRREVEELRRKLGNGS